MKRNLLLTSMFLMLSFFISACSDGGSETYSPPAALSPAVSYPVAEEDNTGSPIDFSNPDSLYGKYQILHYEEKNSEAHVSNNCPDVKCISTMLEGGSLLLRNQFDNLVNADTKGEVGIILSNYDDFGTQFVINKSDIVENYTTSKENPKTFSYEKDGSDWEITFNGTYDKTVGVFKPENDTDKLKIEIKRTNQLDPNTNTFWVYLVVKKISDNQY